MGNEQSNFKEDNKENKRVVPNIDEDILQNTRNFNNSNKSYNEEKINLNDSKESYSEEKVEFNDSKESYSENRAENNYKAEEVVAEKLQEKPSQKINKKKTHTSVKIFGAICVVISIFSIWSFGNISKSTHMSDADRQALKDGYSTAIAAGTILGDADENTGAKDYDISHTSNDKETKIYVWDYADVDGDFVQVLVDDVPISETFMMKHKPREFTVPTVGKVQIKGIKDGGGGITYAIRYDLNGTTYFNYADEGKLNTYTLTKE